MSIGFDLPSNKHSGNRHDYWLAPQKNSKKVIGNDMTREDLVKCREMLNKLDVLCKEYFEATSPEWCVYSSWSFSHEHEDCIIIHYSYSIEQDKWEGSHEYVEFNDLINYDDEQF